MFKFYKIKELEDENKELKIKNEELQDIIMVQEKKIKNEGR